MATPVFTVLEEDKHAWFAGRTRAILKYLDAELGPADSARPRKVLDLGGGAGNMAHHLAHYGEVVSIDFNPRPSPDGRLRGADCPVSSLLSAIYAALRTLGRRSISSRASAI